MILLLKNTYIINLDQILNFKIKGCDILQKKIYAVKTGRKTGIFHSWAECEKQIKGFSGAEYKSFTSIDDAKNYLNYKNEINLHSKENENIVEAYVDGSYDDNLKTYSSGVVILHNGKKITLSKRDNDKDLISMRNVAGELLGVTLAINYIKNNIDDFDKIIIYHDYEGISKWANDEWKTNKKGTIEYKQFIKKCLVDSNIEFVKVKAHSGNLYNDEADSLAKNAIFLEPDSISDINENLIELKFKIANNKDNQKKKKNLYISNEGKILNEKELHSKVQMKWKEKYNGKISDIQNLNLIVEINSSKILWHICANEQDYFDYIELD